MSEETLDAPNQTEGDTKEGLYFGREVPPDSEEACMPLHGPNQWPAQVCLCPFTMCTAEAVCSLSSWEAHEQEKKRVELIDGTST